MAPVSKILPANTGGTRKRGFNLDWEDPLEECALCLDNPEEGMALCNPPETVHGSQRVETYSK